MKKYYRYGPIVLGLAALSFGTFCALGNPKVQIDRYTSLEQPPKIRPDYCSTVIPPNITPLNFLVQEEGTQYYIKIYSRQGRPIEVFSRTPKVVIPEKPWHKLLNINRGQELYFDIFVKTRNGQWNKFLTVTNKIANENIDAYLVYRKMHPTHYWLSGKIGIYQRNLGNFDESLILDNKYYENGCVNCHTFCRNRPDKTLIAVRSGIYGSDTLLIENSKVRKIGAKFTYTTWHPSGRMVTFSINRVYQFFHSARGEVRDAIDLDSTMAYYLVESNTAKTSPQFSKKERLETYPAWSPDGRYLYFCSAPILWEDRKKGPPDNYEQVKYDLVRISYDLEKDQWGELETVLSAQDTGSSSLLPKISPDGRWLLVCMCNYGCFPAFQPSSDLYLVDLEAAEQTGQYEYRRLDINSNKSESYHSFSSNSRWIAFSSKRRDGAFTRLYLGYLDEQGKAYKPFLLPQKDPSFYDSCLKAYNTPELIIKPVPITKEKLARVVRGPRQITVDMPITMATPKADTAPGRYEEPWQQRE